MWVTILNFGSHSEFLFKIQDGCHNPRWLPKLAQTLISSRIWPGERPLNRWCQGMERFSLIHDDNILYRKTGARYHYRLWLGGNGKWTRFNVIRFGPKKISIVCGPYVTPCISSVAIRQHFWKMKHPNLLEWQHFIIELLSLSAWPRSGLQLIK